MLQNFLLRQYRKVYRYDSWMRHHFTVTGHLILVFMVAAAVFGIDTKHSNTYQLFVFLFIILIFSLLNSVFNRLKVQINRHTPRYGTVGEPFTYSVTITNLTAKNYFGLAFIEQLAEQFPDYLQLQDFYQLHKQPLFKRSVSFNQWRRYLAYQRGGMIAVVPLPELGKQPLTITLSFIPLRRGKLNFAESYVAKPDLLGLFRRLISAKELQSCLILPKRYVLKPLSMVGKRKYQAGGVSLANSIGNSSEFMALREYQQGDPLNRIHWKSFAKHGKLIVKEYQDEYFVRRALVLDTFIGEARPDAFEAAVSVAASLAMSEGQQEALLDLMFVGQQTYCFTTGRGVDHLPHLQEILASVQGSSLDTFLPLQQAVLNRVGLCSSFVCVLMHWDDLRQQLIKKLSAQGLAVAVFLIHDGSMTREQCANQPERFYLLNYQQLGVDLAAI
jgi:uncharacterized protein (DUF58 family)